MSQKIVSLPGVGDITIAKRRGSRNIRLSVSAAGKVRVGMPAWLPYAAGVEFANSRRDWILRQLDSHSSHLLTDGGRIGKSYRLRYVHDASAHSASARISSQIITVRAAASLSDALVQEAARKAAERALKKEAEKLLPPRLSELAAAHGFHYGSVKVKRLTSRWGSCSSRGDLALNFFLMQLPWEMIDHVLLHELVHTEHMNHSQAFWSRFEEVSPGAKKRRPALKQYRPVINTLA